MTISKADWEKYIRRLSRVSETASKAMQAFMSAHPSASVEDLIRYAYGLTTRYGEAAAALACEMYDAMAAASGVSVAAAEPAEVATVGEVTAAVRAVNEESPSLLPAVTERMVKRSAADTTLKNAIRDGAEFAWVPHGDTCAFCIMLASNGWQKASKKALKNGHAEHIHSNCDCEYAIRFDSRTKIAGYDPDAYYERYQSADEDGGWREKMNAMRRQDYSANRGKINARKRANYAERQRRAGEQNATEVNEKRISSQKFRMKFRGVTGNAAVDDKICAQARRILRNNTGTSREELVLMDADSGAIIHVLSGGNLKNAVSYDESILEAIDQAHEQGRRIVALHNHPNNTPPSLDDGVSMLYHGYDIGVVATHDGKVYRFTSADKVIPVHECQNIHNSIAYQIKTGANPEEVWYNMLEEFGMHIERMG